MLSETDCPREERLLPLIYLVPKRDLPTRELIEKWSNKNIDRLNQSPIKDYLTWAQADNEIVVFTGYSYCDTQLPKTYNCLLDLENLGNSKDVKATIKFAIWNGILPLEILEHGHKTVCIIEFADGIPDEIRDLPSLDEYMSQKNVGTKFGLCDAADSELIINKIKQRPTTE